MTEPEAKATINRMMELWTKWEPTTEQINIWITVFKHSEPDAAWDALQAAYRQKSHFNTPSPKDYHEQLMLLHGPVNPGVHSSEDGPVLSPLYVEQVETRNPRKPGAKPRRSTWAYPHGLPDEAKMLQYAEKQWDYMTKCYSGRWVIKDSRVTRVFT